MRYNRALQQLARKVIRLKAGRIDEILAEAESESPEPGAAN